MILLLKFMKNKISTSIEEIKTEPSDQQLFEDKPKETQKATKTKARRKQEAMITDSEKSDISKKVLVLEHKWIWFPEVKIRYTQLLQMVSMPRGMTIFKKKLNYAKSYIMSLT